MGDQAYKENVEEQRKEAALKRNKALKTNKKGAKKRAGGKRKTTTKKKPVKTLKKKSSTSSKEGSVTSSLNEGIKDLSTKTKVTKNTASRKKRKLLSTSNSLPSDPFSIAKKSAAKKKSKFIDSDSDDDSEQSPLSIYHYLNEQTLKEIHRKKKQQMQERENVQRWTATIPIQQILIWKNWKLLNLREKNGIHR